MITKINLLPWRDSLNLTQRIDYRNKLILSVLMGLIVIVMFHTYLNAAKNQQQQINNLIKNKSTDLDKELKVLQQLQVFNQLILHKKELIQQLQISRLETFYLIEEIPRLVPDGIFLTLISQNGREITFTGSAQSNSQVSEFMLAIEQSYWFQKPILIEINSSADKTSYQFSLSASQETPSLEFLYDYK